MGNLADLQAAIVDERARRGFTTDPVRLLVLLTEEVGELAREIKKTWSVNYASFDPYRLAPELADTFVLLAALASANGIDLETAVEEKFFGSDRQRSWGSSES